jgi:integrase
VPRILKAAGVDRLTPHGLRHGSATVMLANGVPLKLIQAQLGHRSPTMTNRYAHVIRETQREALTSLDRVARRR